MRYAANRGAAATYSLSRGRGLGLGLLWVLTHFGAGGGFGVGMAAIRHVLPLKLLHPFCRALSFGSGNRVAAHTNR